MAWMWVLLALVGLLIAVTAYLAWRDRRRDVSAEDRSAVAQAAQRAAWATGEHQTHPGGAGS